MPTQRSDPTAPRPAAHPASASPLSLPAFRTLLLAQASFGVAYSIFLILPKHLARNLHAPTGRIGLIMAGAALSNVLAAPWVSRLSGPVGARRAMVLGNLTMMCGAIAFMFVGTPGAGAFLGRALQGMGWALVFSAAGLLAVAIAPRERMAEAIALHGSSNLITNALGPALAEPLLDHFGPRPVFALAAVMAVVAALMSTRVPAPEPPPGPRPRPAAPRPPLAIVLTSLMLGVACGCVFTLHQPLALDRGITRVADFLVAYTLAAIAVRLVLSRVADRLGPGRIAVASFLLYGAVVATMPALGLLGAAGLPVFGALFGLAHGIFFPSLLALAISNATEGGRAKVIAWFNAAFNCGSVVVIPFGVLAESHGFAAAFGPVGLATMGSALALRRWMRLLASRRVAG